MDLKNQVAQVIKSSIETELTLEQIQNLLEVQKHEGHGDIAFPCFIFAKELRKAPQAIAYGENITIDMSSPNIAKPMSMGHLRSTVIGNAIANITTKVGFNPVRINHLGDWGTQFGKLIVGYKKWGSEEAVRENPIQELLKYYVQFHEEAENDESLEDEGRLWFKKLEDGDPEAYALWKWFKDESLKE